MINSDEGMKYGLGKIRSLSARSTEKQDKQADQKCYHDADRESG